MVATAVSGAAAERVGFFPRFIATIIDIVILMVINFVVGFVLGAVMGDAGSGLATGLGTIIGIVYLVYFWSTTGQTIGHKLMNIRVVRTDGSGLTVGQAVIRYIGGIIAGVVFGLGYLWVLWDSGKQGWHDKIAGTCVVRA